MFFERQASLSVFKELLSCGTNIFYWEYAENGDLLYSNCNNLLLNKIFNESVDVTDILNRPNLSDSPILLSSEFGIQWCASISSSQRGSRIMHIIGPTFATIFSTSDMDNMIRNANIPLSARKVLQETISAIPVLPTVMMYQYCLMLHYCVTGKKMERNQIVSMAILPRESEYYSELKKHLSKEQSNAGSYNNAKRKKTYEFERKLLSNVRTGNMDYEKDLNTAGFISEGVNLSMGSPHMRMQTNGIVFITLCTRAAIEGGLSPDIAYTLGDRYIEKINHARTVSESKEILDEMYNVFITEVDFYRKNSSTNHQIIDVMNYIENFPGEDLSLDTLAKRVGYTGEHLSRKFKSETGKTLSMYIRKVRINRAMDMLTSSDSKISDIAISVGYDSPSLFSSYFFAETGMTPSEYREKHYFL